MSTVEVDVARVYVTLGDEVVVDTPVVELESEKVTFVVEAGSTGIVTQILVAPGDVRNVGDPLVIIE